MNVSASISSDTGLEIVDIKSDFAFAARHARARSVTVIPEGMRRIAHALVEDPQTVLQVLVQTAVELCGADSSAISLEKEDRTEDAYYHWVAIAGQYSNLFNAVFPHHPSGCSICLERGRPQRIRADQRYFDKLGVTAEPVTDGLMFPWQTDEVRGTIYILAHTREEAFDQGDCDIMEILADFAAIGVRQMRQQKQLMERAEAAAQAAMANDLAHKINNPLQSLTNVLYLAANGHHGEEAKAVGHQALCDLDRLSSLVRELLDLPHHKIH
jgi:transcriptional regulator with GAF, ATPase, and Fis domain